MSIEIIKVLSHGYAFGNIKKINVNEFNIKAEGNNELNKFINAIEKSTNEIRILKNSHPDMSDYLDIVELMINDNELKNKVINLIDDNHLASNAISLVMNEFIEKLNSSSSEYLRERILDIKDVRDRLIRNLNDDNYKFDLDDKYILVIEELYPSILIALKNNILGVISKKGGYTSHSAIICRELEIPYIIVNDDFADNDVLAINTYELSIIKNPNSSELYDFNNKRNNLSNVIDIDHSGFLFLANVSNNEELEKVLEYGFDGVGLYRTELLLMNRNYEISIEEQTKIYNEALYKIKNKPLIFRTFDVGDDKNIEYIKAKRKGIINYKENPIIIKSQLISLLKANEFNNLKIMFPMIETIDDFKFLKQMVLDICKEYNLNIPPIGITLETKKALENLSDFKNVDFISIGTNDLSKDLYNISREDVIDKLDTYIDDLILKIKVVVDFCNKQKIDLCVCGEIASIYQVIIKLFRIGIKSISASTSFAKTIKKAYLDFKNE